MKVPYIVRRFTVLFMLCAIGSLIVFPVSEVLFTDSVFHWTVKAHLVNPIIIALLWSAAMTYFEAKSQKR